MAATHGALPTEDPRFDPVKVAVAQIARQVDVPPPPLWVQSSAEPNAFACGFTPYDSVITVTTGLVDLLSPTEVRAVLAHEVGRIKLDHIAQTTAVTTRLAQRQGLLTGLHLASTLVQLADTLADDAIFLGLMAARAAHARHTRNKLRDQSFRFEHEADRFAASTGLAPWMRSALRRLSMVPMAPELPSWGRLSHIFSYAPSETHPPTDVRTAAIAPEWVDWYQQRECDACCAPLSAGGDRCPACGAVPSLTPCTRCSTPIAGHHRWCTNCGRRTASACARCGAPDGGGPFCTSCGGSLPTPTH